jgi:L-fucose mutarotase/ribose pyranase (RbsD/FucU family)
MSKNGNYFINSVIHHFSEKCRYKFLNKLIVISGNNYDFYLKADKAYGVLNTL